MTFRWEWPAPNCPHWSMCPFCHKSQVTGNLLRAGLAPVLYDVSCLHFNLFAQAACCEKMPSFKELHNI